MANFPRLRPDLAAWANGSVVTNVEFNTIDGDRVKTINATDGSTHAPSTQIVIGGSGLEVTGPLDATALTATNATIDGGEAVFDGFLTVDGCTANVTNGGAVVMESGSDLEVQTGATLTLGAGTWPAFSAARSATYFEAPTICGMTDQAGSPLLAPPGTPISFPGSDGSRPQVIVTNAGAPVSGCVWIRLPRVAGGGGCTVVSAVVVTKGSGAFTDLQMPSYVLGKNRGTTALGMCSPVFDTHISGDWTTEITQTITATSNQNDTLGTDSYFLKVNLGACSVGASRIHILHVGLSVTHTDLRR